MREEAESWKKSILHKHLNSDDYPQALPGRLPLRLLTMQVQLRSAEVIAVYERGLNAVCVALVRIFAQRMLTRLETACKIAVAQGIGNCAFDQEHCINFAALRRNSKQPPTYQKYFKSHGPVERLSEKIEDAWTKRTA